MNQTSTRVGWNGGLGGWGQGNNAGVHRLLPFAQVFIRRNPSTLPPYGLEVAFSGVGVFSSSVVLILACGAGDRLTFTSSGSDHIAPDAGSTIELFPVLS